MGRRDELLARLKLIMSRLMFQFSRTVSDEQLC